MTVLQAVLFDLDGTLADTAPDLAGAVNRLLIEHGRPAVPVDQTRRHTSSGARGIIGASFGYDPSHADFPRLRERFLDLYADGLCIETVLFPGMEELLARIESASLRWGIVTNKAARFTDPLIRALGLTQRAGCVVSGDTTPKTKPHPEPLLHAARQLALEPSRCVYIGDDLRDIQAARAAGMLAVAARYGYLGETDPPEEWGADMIIDSPMELWAFVQARL
jgi:N-acetyl-D-muramate 6-phosphate phosphatase